MSDKRIHDAVREAARGAAKQMEWARGPQRNGESEAHTKKANERLSSLRQMVERKLEKVRAHKEPSRVPMLSSRPDFEAVVRKAAQTIGSAGLIQAGDPMHVMMLDALAMIAAPSSDDEDPSHAR